MELTKGTSPPFFNINVKITINDKITIYSCKSIQIEQSVQTLTSTARIELPRGSVVFCGFIRFLSPRQFSTFFDSKYIYYQ